MRHAIRWSLILAQMILAIPLQAQLDGARVNWPLPKNLNVLGVHRLAGTVNATLTNLNQIQPSVDIDNELYLLTYSRSQPIFGRSAVFTVVLPAGSIRTNSSLASSSADPFVHGFGDLSLGATVNLFGAPGLMLREYMRYEPKTVVTLGVNGTFPSGQYDGDQVLNLGANQTRLRLSLPMVQSFTKWVPGDRTTLEVVPSVTFLSANDDRAGFRVEEDPLTAVEVHLSRDITRRAFISADYTWLRQGESTTYEPGSGAAVAASDAADGHLVGATVAFQVNENLQLFLTHMQSTAGPEEPVAIEGSLFRVTLTWSFHRVIERRRTYVEGG